MAVSGDGWLRALDDVSFEVGAGRALGVVGESGSGKSTTALAVLGLLAPEARIAGGEIDFHGVSLFALADAERRALRGNRISIVFQDPFASLNPAIPVGRQIAEPLVLHKGLSEASAGEEVRSGDDSVCLDRREGDSPVKLFTVAVGDRRPLGIGASGMALLSAFPQDEIRRVVSSHATRLASHGEPDADALLARLLKAKRLGYAVRDLPKYEGIRAVGMPVFDLEGRPIAALSGSTLAARLTGARFDERLKLLRQHAEAIRNLTVQGAERRSSLPSL